MDTEAILLRAGAEDLQSQEMFSQDISVASSPQNSHFLSQPPQPRSTAATKKSRFSLESALNAKPFVPKSLQKVKLIHPYQVVHM
jgi:hypothetical protein